METDRKACHDRKGKAHMVLRLKVTLKSGMYMPAEKVERTLEVPGSLTLERLCAEILTSIDFEFDHFYMFEILGRTYDGAPPYAPSREHCRVKLAALELKKGDRFSLTYDFGDDWQFDIRVLSVSDQSSDTVRIISQKGFVEQYPDEDNWDEVEDWDEEDLEDDFIEPTWNYQPSDELMDAAFRYKKTGLWKRLWSSEIFSVVFEDGQTGYISLMGKTGDHCAIGLYMGNEGLLSLLDIFDEDVPESLFDREERLHSQNCLQLILDERQYLRDEEYEAVSAYKKAHGIRTDGKNALPHFRQFRPGYVPWHPASAKEENDLLRAAQACLFLDTLLKKQSADGLGFSMFDENTKEIPLLRETGQGWEYAGMTALPQPEPVYMVPQSWNDLAARKAKKLKASEEWQCKLIQYPEPSVVDEHSAPFYPMLLVNVLGRGGMAYPPAISERFYEDPDDLAEQFLNTLLQINERPSSIAVGDERTYAYLTPLAKALGIRLVKKQMLGQLETVLEAMEEDIEKQLGEDPFSDQDDRGEYEDLLEMIEAIVHMPASILRTMPPELKDHLRELIRANVLPPDLSDMLRKKLK